MFTDTDYDPVPKQKIQFQVISRNEQTKNTNNRKEMLWKTYIRSVLQ